MTRQTVIYLLIMVAIALIPTVLAWRAWYKTDRFTLTRWRNIMGVISLGTTAFVWVGVAVLTPLVPLLVVHTAINWKWLVRVVFWGWVILKPVSILALPGAFALKGRSRWLAIVSSAITQYFFSIVYQANIN